MLEASLQVFDYDMALSELKGVGPSTVKLLAKLGLRTARDALCHFPIRYEDRTRLTPLTAIRPQQKVLVQGKVISCQVHRARKRWLEIKIQEKEHTLVLVLFHFSQKQVEVLQRKPLLRCYGECKPVKGQITMVHPEMQFVTEHTPILETLTPIYPTTKGLSQMMIGKLVAQVLDMFKQSHVTESMPHALCTHYGLMSVQEAFSMVHQPTPDVSLSALEERIHPAFQRLILEELLAHQVSLRYLREVCQQQKTISLPKPQQLIEQFLETLPFKLTGAQVRAVEAVAKDIKSDKPMMRLVQGDVGSGKTVVAAIACLFALANKSQVAVLAPTEILAKQHYEQFKAWLAPFGFEVVFLKGSLKQKEKREALAQLKTPKPLVAVGTHALFQESVEFHNLSLMVVDEQHRFGVEQRQKLRAKGQAVPHQLVMTATPIPRTLAMTRYQDLDLTVIDELPPGRKAIQTLCINQDNRAQVIEKIDEVIKKGQQIYWVCPLIEESEKLQIQAAEMAYEEIAASLDHPIACVHGRLSAQDKETLMAAFVNGETKILVATTVIEVGVNVPNATLMVIENAERLGLAQLHQLRGRVGRGSEQSFCLLLYKSPLSPHAKRRLEVMRKTNDGFIIAEEDLNLRGPGEVLGVRQTGLQMFRVACLFRDKHLIEAINDYLEDYTSSLQALFQTLSQTWVGDKSNYHQV